MVSHRYVIIYLLVFLAKLKRPIAECLGLYCGFEEVERRLADLGVFLHCTGIDLSPRAVQSARAKAGELGYNNRDIDIRYYNGGILFYALDRKFYEEYDHITEKKIEHC